MARIERQPGRDITFTVTIKQDGEAVDLAGVTGLAIILSVDDDRVIAQWSMVPDVEGYMNANVGSPTSGGTMQLKLPGKLTSDLNNVQSYLEVVRQENDGGSQVDFGMKDGKKKEFVYFTTTAKPRVENVR